MSAPPEGDRPLTDRRIRTVDHLDRLDFDKGGGLLPVVVQDASNGRTLMLAYGNREALESTLRTGEVHFWSRSRQKLWRKGETSGNVLRLRSLHSDCDGDAVLARVEPTGPACHTGEETCFGDGTEPDGLRDTVLDELWDVLEERARERPEGSWTVRLLEDENLRLKKLGEETAELLVALAREDREGARRETADLIYHLLVALLASGSTLDELWNELRGRRRG